ncbi:DUF3515 domain-containing protein [Streptomyces sp. NPDC059740]|uniref:DUF3515 domain-containing protein n=1 Tax=Streptomyces sp. NPDC059740 TaxID=3346926 RepID=UPI003650D5F6
MLGRVSSSRRRSLALPLFALALAAAGCSSSDGGPAVAVPHPSGDDPAHCRALAKRLPDTVAGAHRRTTDPVSPYTAAWGDPAVQLRCGVAKPEALQPGSEHYNPDADSADVNGVEWLFEKQDDGYLFTTVLRKTYVAVRVPGHYSPEVDALVDLASAVRSTVPAGV